MNINVQGSYWPISYVEFKYFGGLNIYFHYREGIQKRSVDSEQFFNKILKLR